MSSKRPPPKNPFPIQTNTFGKAPAAIYLCHLLNEAKDVNMLRRISALFQAQRTLLKEVVAAHKDYDVLSTKSLGALLTMMANNIRDQVGQGIRKDAPFFADLVVNILDGDIKTWRNRQAEAKKRFVKLQRTAAPGTVFEQNWCPADEVEGEKTVELLRERSKKYLERKGKKDTLY
jgi:hypothetical protein